MRDGSGQMYRRNRYYDPATGQFTQQDPIGIAGGLNTYGFAAGDPVSYSDPYGLCAASRVDNDTGLCPGGLSHAEYYAKEDGSIAAPRTVAEQQICKDVPQAPRGVSLRRNLRIGQLHRLDPARQLWFYEMVRNGGPWDYKQRGPQYEAFGNFNYGAAGSAAGFSSIILYRAAGAAQVRAAHPNRDGAPRRETSLTETTRRPDVHPPWHRVLQSGMLLGSSPPAAVI